MNRSPVGQAAEISLLMTLMAADSECKTPFTEPSHQTLSTQVCSRTQKRGKGKGHDTSISTRTALIIIYDIYFLRFDQVSIYIHM